MTQARIKTLLLTDSGTIDRMLFAGLDQAQYDVQSLHSKEEDCLQKLFDMQPDLVFLKAELTHAHGIELCDHIRTHASLKNTKIVFLSSNPDAREQAIQHRVDRFLSLPFTLQDIRTASGLLTAKRRKVLYVDDSDMMHQAVVPSLREEGYEVLEAWDGQEALALLDEEGGKVDLILSDVEMPVMNGYTLCKNVRLSMSEDIPFVLLTSLDTEDAILQGFEVGTDDYILKPVVIPELLSRVRRLLSAGQLYGVARPERILAVDDSDVILKMTTKALNAQGFQVDTAEHGLAALSKLRERAYHLLLTDFEMPHMDGVELCQRIRKGETGCPNIPILFATTRTSKTDVVRMRSIGAQAVVAKPFKPELVVAEVERVLAEVRMERKHKAMCHFFPKRVFTLDSSQNFQDPSFAEDQFRTLLSTRIANFSTLTKQLKSHEVVQLINQYLERMAQVVEPFGVVIERVIEDRISLSFGGDDADIMQALHVVMAMMEALPSWHETTQHVIQVAAAVHAGHVIIGNMGLNDLERKMAPFGESVHVVRAIRNHAKGGEILLSDVCLERVRTLVEVEDVGSVKVLEKDDVVGLFRLKALKEKVQDTQNA